jgi:hypothetical protein
VPNNVELALILYRGPIRTAGAPDPAALFEANAMDGRARGETASTISSPKIHEVLGIARGHVTVRFGGSRGRAFNSTGATSRSCRRERGTTGLTKAMISSSLAHIRRSENTISAGAPGKSMNVP